MLIVIYSRGNRASLFTILDLMTKAVEARCEVIIDGSSHDSSTENYPSMTHQNTAASPLTVPLKKKTSGRREIETIQIINMSKND